MTSWKQAYFVTNKHAQRYPDSSSLRTQFPELTCTNTGMGIPLIG